MTSNNLVAGILIGHGELPGALQKTVEKIIGVQEHFQIVSNENCSANELKNRLAQAVQKFDKQDVIIFVDLLGGSCANISRQLLPQFNAQKVGILCGVNVATLIKYFQYRERLNFTELLQLLSDTAKQEITTIT